MDELRLEGEFGGRCRREVAEGIGREIPICMFFHQTSQKMATYEPTWVVYSKDSPSLVGFLSSVCLLEGKWKDNSISGWKLLLSFFLEDLYVLGPPVVPFLTLSWLGGSP